METNKTLNIKSEGKIAWLRSHNCKELRKFVITENDGKLFVCYEFGDNPVIRSLLKRFEENTELRQFVHTFKEIKSEIFVVRKSYKGEH